VTLFTGARLIVGDGTTIEHAAFLVQNDLILQVGVAGEISAPVGAGTVNLAGRTVMPALVNAHSDLGWEGYTSWGSQNMTRENLIGHLNRHAYYGVGTTAGTGSEKEDIALSADFLVLDANPLDDIMNSRKISRVYLRGEEIDRAAQRAAWTK
jgi:imidazolonepropionase-like amidohydrolase